MIRVPGGVIEILFNPAHHLAVQDRAQPAARPTAPSTCRRAAHLGGSSAINGMIYNRGHATGLRRLGASRQPRLELRRHPALLQALERRIGGVDSEFRGRDGLLPVTDTDWRKPFVRSLHRRRWPASASRAIPTTTAPRRPASATCSALIENGWRVSAARAFLRPAISRGNLDVRVGAHASPHPARWQTRVGVAYVEAGNPSAQHVVRARARGDRLLGHL